MTSFSMMILAAVACSLLAAPVPMTAQGATLASNVVDPNGATGIVNCEYCTDNPFYMEHAHGYIQTYYMTNEQNHGGGWYAFYCGVDHDFDFAMCKDPLGALEQANHLAQLVREPGHTLADLELAIERASESGLTAETNKVGVTIAAVCEATGERVAFTVPLPEEERRSLRSRVSRPALQTNER